MDTESLKYLLEAARIGSISKTAEKFGYSQSALVHKMNALEHDLGIQLLIRSHNGVELTQKARELEPYIRAIVDNDFYLRQKIDVLQNNSSDKLSVVSLPSISMNWLPRILSQFEESDPHLQLEIKVMGFSLSEVVEHGEAAFGLTDEAHKGNNAWIPIKEDLFQVALRIDHPLASLDVIPLEKLKNEALLLPAGNPYNPAYMVLKDIAKKNILIYQDGVSAMLSMVTQGIGVSVLSSLFEPTCPSNVVMRPTEPTISRTLGVIARTFRSLPPTKKKFIDFLRHECF